MAKGPKKRSSSKKRGQATEAEPRAIQIKITKTDTKDIALAIQEKLEAESTDLFRNSDTLIIICEKFGGP